MSGTTPAGPARANAILAVECDPVRLHDRLLDVRLSAAVALAPRVEVAESLLLGVPVPVERLDPRWVARLCVTGAVTLDLELAYTVLAHGPVEVRA